MMNTPRPVGELLRVWRQQRRLSQLDLALNADVSARHISFLETGRSLPSREMLLHLAAQLDLPLRDRNTLLVAAGYAPVYAKTSLDEPAMRVAREAVDLVLAGHEPYPAVAVDRHWNLVTANRAIGMFLTGAAAHLLEPPINVLRMSLHPDGLAQNITNLEQWRSHVLARLQMQIELTADAVLSELYEELRAYPCPIESHGTGQRALHQSYGDLVVPIVVRTQLGEMAFFTTTTIFGTAVDITLDELVIESFFPANQATADAFRRMPAQ